MKIVIMADGGRRFTGDDVRYLQSNVQELTSALADFAANEYPADTPVIITGIRFTDTGSSITASAGWLHWQGELLQFIPPVTPIGVTGLPNVKLYRAVNDDQVLAYEDGGSLEVIHKNRYVTLQTTDWVDNDANVDEDDRITTADLRRARMHCEGDIKMFVPRAGKTLTDYYDPGTGLGKAGLEGWAICDGRNGTPDMRGRAPIGYSEVGYVLADVVKDNEYAVIGTAGGKRKVKLKSSESGLREHGHPATAEVVGISDPGVYHVAFASPGGAQHLGPKDLGGVKNIDSNPALIGSQDAVDEHESRMPYRVMAYFQRIQDN